MRKRVPFFCVFVILMSFSATAINFSRVNVAWQYDTDFEIKMAHRVVRTNDGVKIFLRISSDSISDWQYEFLLQNGYESESHKTIQPTKIPHTGDTESLDRCGE